VLIFWHWIKPLSPGGLLKSERWVIVFGFVAAALVTPTPDIVNQTMIAGPVIGLYQFGVFAVLSSIRRTGKATKAQAKRKQLLLEVEQRRERALQTQAAYRAHAISLNTAAPATIPDVTFVSTAANTIAAPHSSPARPSRVSMQPTVPQSNHTRLRNTGSYTQRKVVVTSRAPITSRPTYTSFQEQT
jgi:hypothetical protein